VKLASNRVVTGLDEHRQLRIVDSPEGVAAPVSRTNAALVTRKAMMSAHEHQSEDSAGNTHRAADQADRAADESNEAGSYSAERYPEDPGSAAPPLDSRHASEPPESD
jgi:hypothetical protein